MQLARSTDFSLRVLMLLANGAGAQVTAAELAGKLNIPREQMMKIVQRLAKAGYLATTRGNGGGVRLALASEDIRIGRVIRDIEPNLAIVDCRKPLCPLAGTCRLKAVLDRARNRFLEELDAVSLTEVSGLSDFRGFFAPLFVPATS